MGRILALVLGLLVLVFVAYKVVYGRSLSGDHGGAQQEAPPQALEGAKGAARRIEDDSVKRSNEALDVKE